jgi:hypothetical protein
MRSFWSGLVLLLALAAGGATADPLVYHSPGDTGNQPATAPNLPKASSVTLYLWLDPGPTAPSGDLCDTATGDASCAYDLRVQVMPGGDVQFLAFEPTGAACAIGCKLTPNMLRVNRLLTSTPLIGRQKLGQLTVNTLGPAGGEIWVTGVHSVGAARQLANIPHKQIAYVPEPDQLVLLLSGLAGLAVLHRLRGSR